MTNKYYYLAAQLPYLKFNTAAAISIEKFLDECTKWLTGPDMKIILSSAINCPSGTCEKTALLSEWKDFDDGLRHELALARIAKKNGTDYKAEKLVKDILSKENPLKMEEALEGVRWDFLEGKKLQYFFDVNFLVLYYLQLQILKRISGFDKDKGETYFYELCEVNYEGAIR